jgi:HSP20 family molecular chaperone IbpA
MFNEFDDLFSGIFNRFRRPVMDQKYFKVFRKENKGYIILFNTLGMSKEDIEISVEKPKGSNYKVLHIRGEKDIEDVDFHNSVDMAVQLNFMEEIESTQYSVKDGLTRVFLKIKLPEKQQEKITYIDDSTGLDW